MSWRLVASTTTGWKKYKDSHGNDRFQRPNGQIANAAQYNGSLSTGEEIDETDTGFTPPPRDPYDEIEEKDDLKTYENARDYIIHFNRNLCSGLIGVDWETQFKRLWNIVEDVGVVYDKFSFGIKYTVVKDKGKDDTSEVHTNMRSKENAEPTSRIEFVRMGQKLSLLCDSYKEVIVHDVRLKARKY